MPGSPQDHRSSQNRSEFLRWLFKRFSGLFRGGRKIADPDSQPDLLLEKQLEESLLKNIWEDALDLPEPVQIQPGVNPSLFSPSFQQSDQESIEWSSKQMMLRWDRKYRDIPEMAQVLKRGLEGLKDEIKGLSTCMQNGQIDDISETLHAMKGFPGGFGLKEIHSRIRELESVAGHQSFDEKAFSCHLSELLQLVDVTLRQEVPWALKDMPDRPAADRSHLRPSRNRSKRILIADDDRLNCEMIAYLLGRIDVDYDIVHNGEEVLTSLEADRYDLLLLDIRMPVLGGIETLRRIRHQPDLQDLYIIVMTADDDHDQTRLKSLGYDQFVAKPIDLEDLTKKIRKALQRSDS